MPVQSHGSCATLVLSSRCQGHSEGLSWQDSPSLAISGLSSSSAVSHHVSLTGAGAVDVSHNPEVSDTGQEMHPTLRKQAGQGAGA